MPVLICMSGFFSASDSTMFTRKKKNFLKCYKDKAGKSNKRWYENKTTTVIYYDISRLISFKDFGYWSLYFKPQLSDSESTQIHYTTIHCSYI